MHKFNKENVGDIALDTWQVWRKKRLTQAIRIDGPFEVETREGTLSCPDGYLAVDSMGWPYPIAKDEFENIYEEVDGTD